MSDDNKKMKRILDQERVSLRAKVRRFSAFLPRHTVLLSKVFRL